MKYFLGIVSIFFITHLYGQVIGTLDLAFGNSGIVKTVIDYSNTKVLSTSVKPNGHILTLSSRLSDGGGPNLILSEYTPDGLLDNAFGNDGQQYLGYLYDVDEYSVFNGSMLLLPDGKILVAGYQEEEMVITKWDSTGNIDTDFGSFGLTGVNFDTPVARAYAMAVQADGKIVVTGYIYDNSFYEYVAMTRLNSNGMIDSTFATNGKFIRDFGGYSRLHGVVIQPDGKIVVCGFALSHMLVMRFQENGTPDSTFAVNGIYNSNISTYYEYGYSVALQSDGKIIVGGTSNDNHYVFTLVRLNDSGMVDSSFGTNGIVKSDINESSSMIFQVLTQPDDKIIAAGGAFLDSVNFFLARYNGNGNLDYTFGNNGVTQTSIGENKGIGQSVSFAPESKVVVAGFYFDSVYQYYGMCLARYTTDFGTGNIDANSTKSPFVIYPNPANFSSTLSYELTEGDYVTIEMLDARGKIDQQILSYSYQTEGPHAIVIHLDNINSGIHILKFQTRKECTFIKVLKI